MLSIDSNRLLLVTTSSTIDQLRFCPNFENIALSANNASLEDTVSQSQFQFGWESIILRFLILPDTIE